MQRPCPFPPLGPACLQIPVTQDSTEKCHHLANNRFTTQLERSNLSAAYHYSWMRRQVNWVPLERGKKKKAGGGCRCVHWRLVNSLWATDAPIAHFSSNPNHWPNKTSWLQCWGQVCPLLLLRMQLWPRRPTGWCDKKLICPGEWETRAREGYRARRKKNVHERATKIKSSPATDPKCYGSVWVRNKKDKKNDDYDEHERKLQRL